LLRLCAFYAPDDPIPFWLIHDGAEHLPPRLRKFVEDDFAWNEAIALVGRYSLLDASSGALSLHHLVQVVVRDSLSESGQQRWAATAVSVMREAFPHESYDVRTWDECASLLPHALAVTGHAEAMAFHNTRVVWILDRCASYSGLRES
jgi:hypothetical protein